MSPAKLFPSDENLMVLRAGECNTDNLSPYPGIAAKGEKMDHDVFMRARDRISEPQRGCS